MRTASASRPCRRFSVPPAGKNLVVNVEAFSITLPAEQGSVSRARAFVARAVADHVDDPSALVLMASELVTNVVDHVGSELTLTVREGPIVRVEIHNHQAATEAFRDLLHTSTMPDRTSPGGRGLGLVRALATRVGLDDDPAGGKVVWFEWEPPSDDTRADAVVEVGSAPMHEIVEPVRGGSAGGPC